MSTVLWAHTLANGEVFSDESDLWALNKFTKQLDKITKRNGWVSFLKAIDTTDLQYSFADEPLPNGFESIEELVMAQGKWLKGDEAVELLSNLINQIKTENIKFGLMKNHQETVLFELSESLKLAQKAKTSNGKFNFCVVG